MGTLEFQPKSRTEMNGENEMKSVFAKTLTALTLAAALAGAAPVPAFAAESSLNECCDEEINQPSCPSDEPESRPCSELKWVSKYSLEPSKYYMVAVYKQITRPGGLAPKREKIGEMKVKLLTVYEDPYILGRTRRTAVILKCDTGEQQYILCDDYSFYALN